MTRTAWLGLWARTRIALPLAALVVLGALAIPAGAAALPDGRGYEMVTPVDKNGNEVGPGIGATNGNSADWQAIGGCCGASSAASTLYRSSRTAGGWQTTAETPTPPGPLVGLFAEQQPVWYSSDLTKTIYTTPASYDIGNHRPPSPTASPYLDLYEQGMTSPSSMTWLTQGPFAGAGTNPTAATFAAATPDGNAVAFNTTERLTQDATGLASLNSPPQFLYVRKVHAGTTSLVDVTNTSLTGAVTAGAMTIPVASTTAFAPGQPVTIGSSAGQETGTVASVPDATDITLSSALVKPHASGEAVEALISPAGAIAGNGNYLDQGFLPADTLATTTNSISSDGSKVFFESPPTFPGGVDAEGVGPSHLYMRNLTTQTTTPIDNPSPSGGAVYEGASQDGALVFFTSTEGLAGDANTNNELYEFNTNTGTVTALSNDAANTDPNFVGITAISNDGSHVWFVDKDALPDAHSGPSGAPNQGDMNFYVYDTAANTTTFIGAVGSGVTGDNRDKKLLTGEPDISRGAIPTPDGSVMVFGSSANLTKQNPSGPSTTLTADVPPPTNTQPVLIQVASSAGYILGRTVEIQSFLPESATIMGIPDSTHMLVSSTGLFFPPSSGDPVVQLPPLEVYRYVSPTGSNPAGSITCVSCPPAGTATGGAGLGASYGGSYQPAYEGVPMSSDGSRIFFTSPDPLTPGVISSPPIPIGLFGGLAFVSNVYEWENGSVSLISDGHSSTGSSLGSTTPSGNDVFFTTEDKLLPQDADGYDDIYDARVGGGFPAPPTPLPPCGSADTCRPSVAPTQFFPMPATATVSSANPTAATFHVNAITRKQRAHLVKTGKVTLTVRASQAGKISAVVSALMKGQRVIVDTTNRSLFATNGGKVKLTVHLGKAARKTLARKHKLTVDITVSYSQSSEAQVATLKLTTKGKHATTRRSGTRRRARER